MMLHNFFWIAMAVLMFVVAPIGMIWCIVDLIRGKKGTDDERRGGGGISNVVGGAMLELDRLLTRPSVEHTIDAEHPTLKREDDSGGD